MDEYKSGMNMPHAMQNLTSDAEKDPLFGENFNAERNASLDFTGDDHINQQYVIPHFGYFEKEDAWKDYRESAMSCFLRCLRYLFSIGILSGALIIGIVGTLLALIWATFGGFCASSDNLPKIAHQIRLIGRSTGGWFIEFSHVFVMYITFGKEVISQLHIFEWNLSIAFLDTIYRLYWYVYIGDDDSPYRVIPIQIMIMSVISFNSFRIAKQFFTRNRERFILVLQIGLQFVFSIAVVILTLHFIIPKFVISSPNDQALIAVMFTLLGFGIKHISKMAAQHMEHVTHPGTTYGVLICTYVGIGILCRMLQAEMKTPFLFSIICILHSFFGFLERLSLTFKELLYKNQGEKCARKQRLIADVTICSLIQETAAIVVTLITVQFMKYKFSVLAKEPDITLLYIIIPRFIFAVVIEFLFSICAIFILTWYHNVPIMQVWQKKWRKLLLANLGIFCFGVLYVTTYIVRLTATTYKTSLIIIPNQCDITEIYFFMR